MNNIDFNSNSQFLEYISELEKKIQTLKNSIDEYEKSFDYFFNNNHLIVLLIDPDNGVIKDANQSACLFYGYSLEEITKKKIFDINILSKDKVLLEIQKAAIKKKKNFYFQHQLANGEIRDVEVHSGPIKINGKNLLYSIILDITDRRQASDKINESYLKLNQIFNTIAVGMRVVDLNFNIIEINERMLSILGRNKRDILGKKCYEIFCGQFCHTSKCPLTSIINGAKYVEYEVDKWINEYINSSFIVTATPYRDVYGKLVGIVQCYKENSERKMFESQLKESEERYRRLFELSPDAIIIYSDGKIDFANNAAARLYGVDSSDELKGLKILDVVHPDSHDLLKERVSQVYLEGKTTSFAEYKVIKLDGSVIHVEIISSLFEFNGKPAVQAVIRDINERKKELERAAKIQKQRLETQFPLSEKANFELIYMAAKEISGDFFHLHKTGKNEVIGILGDVSGKGLSAALSNSALKLLFYDVSTYSNDPMDIIIRINQEVRKHLEDEYVAACCFRFDFVKNELKIVSAGINKFSYCKSGDYCINEEIKGPSLGMLDKNIFDEKTISFQKNDKFYFYSDGIENIYEDLTVLKKIKKYESIEEQKVFLEKRLLKLRNLIDDVTWLAVEIK